MKNKYNELRLRSFDNRLLDYVDELVRIKNSGRKHSFYNRKDIIEEIINRDIEMKSSPFNPKSKLEIEKSYQKMAKKIDRLQETIDDLLEQNTVLLAIELKERGLLSE